MCPHPSSAPHQLPLQAKNCPERGCLATGDDASGASGREMTTDHPAPRLLLPLTKCDFAAGFQSVTQAARQATAARFARGSKNIAGNV